MNLKFTIDIYQLEIISILHIFKYIKYIHYLYPKFDKMAKKQTLKNQGQWFLRGGENCQQMTRVKA